jgi:tetratricopeptide (TPR) repeat protein
LHAYGLWALTETLFHSGKLDQAESLLAESRAVFDGVGTPHYEASTHWSLAFADMLLGRWERATSQAQMSLALARAAGVPFIAPMSYWLLACLSLAEGERALDPGVSPYMPEGVAAREAYGEARRLAQESVGILRELLHRSALAQILPILAAAELGFGNLARAQEHLCEALRISGEIGVFEPLLFALAATALFLAQKGEKQRAVEVYSLASRYPFVGSSRWFEDVLGRHISKAAAHLPLEAVAAAKERGRARDAWATCRELAEEFGGGRTGSPSGST